MNDRKKMTDAIIVDNNCTALDFMRRRFSIENDLFIMINEIRCNEIRMLPIEDRNIYKLWVKIRKYSSGSIERSLKHHGVSNIIFTPGIEYKDDYFTYECYFYQTDVKTSIESLREELMSSSDVTDVIYNEVE